MYTIALVCAASVAVLVFAGVYYFHSGLKIRTFIFLWAVRALIIAALLCAFFSPFSRYPLSPRKTGGPSYCLTFRRACGFLTPIRPSPVFWRRCRIFPRMAREAPQWSGQSVLAIPRVHYRAQRTRPFRMNTVIFRTASDRTFHRAPAPSSSCPTVTGRTLPCPATSLRTKHTIM